jgi:hypothetical protein
MTVLFLYLGCGDESYVSGRPVELEAPVILVRDLYR